MEKEALFILIPIGLIFTVILAFFIYMFARYVKLTLMGKLRVHFIYDDNKIEIKNYYKVVDKIEYDNIEYDYDDNVTVKRKGIKNIYYVVGNKTPIDFTSGKIRGMSYNDYKTVMKSKVISDLLQEEKGLSQSEKMLLLIMVLVGAVVIGALVYFNKQPVVLPLDETYKQFIKTAVTEAIKGV